MVKNDNKKDVKKTTEKIIEQNTCNDIINFQLLKKTHHHNITMVKNDNKKDVKKPFSKQCNNTHKFYCSICDYTTSKKYNLEKHFLTQKHKKMKSSKSSKKVAKVAKVAKSINDNFENNYFENIFSYKNDSGDFFCSKCKFNTKHLHNFKRHLKTKKHNSGEKFMNNRYLCDCGKEYNYQSGLSRHKLKCSYINKNQDDKNKPKKSESSEIFEMIKKKINFNQTIINNTNHYQNTNINMQIYLNENCKDAMNIQDFVNSLDYTIKSLTDIVTDTITDNVSNIIIKKLNNIDFKQRPIHCLDENNIVYIKDKDFWECDNNKIILNNTINQVVNNKTQHELNSLNEWSSNNPQWHLNNNLANNFYKANKKINDNNSLIDNHKIIKNIINTVSFDKKLLLKDKIEN